MSCVGGHWILTLSVLVIVRKKQSKSTKGRRREPNYHLSCLYSCDRMWRVLTTRQGQPALL